MASQLCAIPIFGIPSRRLPTLAPPNENEDPLYLDLYKLLLIFVPGTEGRSTDREPNTCELSFKTTSQEYL